eukprot:2541429-Ditylum_brightwellii.AAC.1
MQFQGKNNINLESFSKTRKKLQKNSVKIHLNKEKPISDLLTSQQELNADKSSPTDSKPRHNISQNNEKPTSDLLTC